MAKVIREGFWKSEYEPDLQIPVSLDKPTDNLNEFMYRFRRIENITRYGTMDGHNYELFDCKYAFSNLTWDRYSGYSFCRFQCKDGDYTPEMGDIEIETWYKDTHFIFPNGYRHYIENHNVHPSDEFYEMIMNFEPKQITSYTREEKEKIMISINIRNLWNGSSVLRYSK